jgi:MFS family permease
MVRLVLGIIAGIVAAVATIGGLNLMSHMLHPIPAGLRAENYAAIGAFIKAMPAWALAMIALAWFLGPLVGGLVAGLVSRRSWTVWMIGLVVFLAAAVNVFNIPHPLLLQIAAFVAPVAGTLLALRILGDRGALSTEPGVAETRT